MMPSSSSLLLLAPSPSPVGLPSRLRFLCSFFARFASFMRVASFYARLASALASFSGSAPGSGRPSAAAFARAIMASFLAFSSRSIASSSSAAALALDAAPSTALYRGRHRARWMTMAAHPASLLPPHLHSGPLPPGGVRRIYDSYPSV